MSCLFDSVYSLLEENFSDKSINIREVICNYIKNNPHEQIGGETIEKWLEIIGLDEFNKSTYSYNDYVDLMENNSQWGGGPEMSIISKIFDVIIKIKYNDNIIATFECCKDPLFILILKWTGDHYEPVTKLVL